MRTTGYIFVAFICSFLAISFIPNAHAQDSPLLHQVNPVSPLAIKSTSPGYIFPAGFEKTLRLSFSVICQEYMSWKHSPLSNPKDPWWFWWGYPERLQPGSYWRRNLRLASYPYIGPYTTKNPKVATYSMTQAKNCGLTALVFHMFNIYSTGKAYANEKGFSDVLDAAGKIGFKIFFYDDNFFVPFETVQNKDNIILRHTDMLRKYGNKPGYLKINRSPVCVFRLPDNVTPETISEILRTVEINLGHDVYWVLQKPYDEANFVNIKEVDALQGPEIASMFLTPDTPTPKEEFTGNYDWDKIYKRMQEFHSEVKAAGKAHWAWLLPSFDSRSQWTHSIYEYYPDNHFNGLKGEVLLKQLYLAQKVGVDNAIITSWNCFGENTAIEANWDRDGYNGDPFFYQKLISNALGRKWQDPPKPPKEIVDPLLWWKVFGIDKNGPLIPKSEIRMGDLIIDVEDNTSLPSKLFCTRNGDAYYRIHSDGFEVKNLKLLNPENAEVFSKHGIEYIKPKTGTLQFQINCKLLPGKKLYLVLRYDGNSTNRLVSYPSIIEDYQDPVGDTHEGWLPKFWAVDREDPALDKPKITIEALPHTDLTRSPFTISLAIPVNLIGIMQIESGRIVTDYTDIEGLRKRFRQPLWNDLLIGDVLVLSGVDGKANIGFPMVMDVTHLGY